MRSNCWRPIDRDISNLYRIRKIIGRIGSGSAGSSPRLHEERDSSLGFRTSSKQVSLLAGISVALPRFASHGSQLLRQDLRRHIVSQELQEFTGLIEAKISAQTTFAEHVGS